MPTGQRRDLSAATKAVHKHGKLMPEYKLTKNGLFDGEEKASNRVWTYLAHPTKIEDGVTLGDIFAWVEQNDQLTEFIGEYSWCWSIDDFHEHARLSAKHGLDDDPLLYIEIHRHAHIFTNEQLEISVGI